MRAETRLFGVIDIPDEKVIVLENGMIGFPELQHFALIFDAEKENGGKIKWLQSMDDPATAFPGKQQRIHLIHHHLHHPVKQ